MRPKRSFALAVLLFIGCGTTGCAVAHRYPAYKGRVLELGTDKPIEGAGVMAKYNTKSTCIAGNTWAHLGYQQSLTDAEGRFEIPSTWYAPLRPFSWFDDEVRITIFKYGYGSYPGSFGRHGPILADAANPYAITKYGEITPAPSRLDRLAPDQPYTIRLPKLETQAEMEQHYRLFDKMLDIGGPWVPPSGTTSEQFGYGNPEKLWRKPHEDVNK